MFGTNFEGGDAFGRLADRVRRMGEPDLSAMAEEVRQEIVTGLTRMAEAGVDSWGARLALLAPSTVRRRHHRDEPLEPDGRHPFIHTLRVEASPRGWSSLHGWQR